MQTNPNQFSMNCVDLHRVPNRKSRLEKMMYEAVWLKLLIVTWLLHSPATSCFLPANLAFLVALLYGEGFDYCNLICPSSAFMGKMYWKFPLTQNSHMKWSNDKWISKDFLISCFLKAFIWAGSEIQLRWAVQNWNTWRDSIVWRSTNLPLSESTIKLQEFTQVNKQS